MHQLTTNCPTQYRSNAFKVLSLYLSASECKLLFTILLSSTQVSYYQFSNFNLGSVIIFRASQFKSLW